MAADTLTWDDIKAGGSAHYKDGATEPIDLYRDLGILRHWAIGEICQHALRNRNTENPININDMDKIIHYAQMLKVALGP